MIIRKNIKKKEEGYIQLIVKQTYINKKTKKNQEEDKGLNTTLQYSHNQVVTNRLAKGHLLLCKRAPFTTQKGTFCIAKCALLENKKCSIGRRQ